ncbi:acyl carrier protein [Pelagophyceae sp. CCMP2097]|nr:acyl carrier protein [Pelagophyceae sp. CCMP2097]
MFARIAGRVASRSIGAAARPQFQRPSFAPATVRLFSTAEAFLPKDECTERILGVVKAFEKVDPNLVRAEADFKSLALDSLDIVEVVMAIEEEFAIEIPDNEADKILTIADAVDYVSTHPMAK